MKLNITPFRNSFKIIIGFLCYPASMHYCAWIVAMLFLKRYSIIANVIQVRYRYNEAIQNMEI